MRHSYTVVRKELIASKLSLELLVTDTKTKYFTIFIGTLQKIKAAWKT